MEAKVDRGNSLSSRLLLLLSGSNVLNHRPLPNPISGVSPGDSPTINANYRRGESGRTP